MSDTFPPIGIMGPAGHGKSTLAQIIAGYGGRRVMGFAEPLKGMLASLGLTGEDLYGEDKETPHPILCGRTPREAMQTLGTEWGRDLIGADLWVNAWRYKVEGSGIVRVVADDVRFANEVKTIRDLGGFIWRIVDPRKPIIEDHPSEGFWRQVSADVEISNNGDLDDLKAMVAGVMADGIAA